jgi:hypothetical protein
MQSGTHMIRNREQLNRVVTLTALTAMILGGQIVFAKTQGPAKGYKVLSETNLGTAKTTSMFLRQDHRGHEFLYVASDAGILSIFDVSNPAEPRRVDDLKLTEQKALSAFGRLAIGSRLQRGLQILRKS